MNVVACAPDVSGDPVLPSADSTADGGVAEVDAARPAYDDESPEQDGVYPEDEEAGETVGVAREAILGGRPETSLDAVVRIQHDGNCTGTLIRPDVILTNGHCIARVPLSARGRWTAASVTGRAITIRVGPSGATATFTTTADWVMLPPSAPDGAGHDDVALLGLSTPVPSSAARWLRVATDAPGVPDPTYSSTHRMTVVGWGEFYNGRAFGRAQGFMTNAFRDCSGQANMRQGTWFAGTGPYVPGDSGSPVLFPTGVGSGIPGAPGPVVAGVMGNSSCGGGGYLATFSRGSSVKPDIGAWLTSAGTRSLCAQQGSMLSQDGRFRRLMSWWSDVRLDNHTTTLDGYFGCYADWTDVIYSGGPYGFYRHEGWVADPADPQPAGTVALDLYWNASTLDNATTTAATRPPAPWTRVRTLGYVWTSPGAGRVALRLWYSASRQDYQTTTGTADLSSGGYVRVGATGIIGYVPTAGSIL